MLAYIAPVLALAGTVAAQCSVSGTTTIQNSGDATALASACKTFTGSIAIATGTTDAIDLSGIRRIAGSLVVDNATVITSLSGADLEVIDDTFLLREDQILSSLSFPRLTQVDTIDWQGLPNLGSVIFTTGLQFASSISIRNTYLNSLDGITTAKSVASFYLSNNNFLNAISIELKNLTTALTLEDNGSKMFASFPNLQWANNMTFRNCPNVSLPALQATNGSLGFYENTLQTLSLNNLTTVGGSLSFVSNTQMSSLMLPNLKSVGGGFSIQNNTALDTIDLPALTTITGALDFFGNFSNVSMPVLKDIKGAFNMQSSGNLDDECATFKKESGSTNVIKGKFVCQGSVSKPGGAGTTPTATASGSSASKTGAATVQVASVSLMGFSGLLAAIFGLL